MKPHMLEVLKLCRNTEEAIEMVDGYIHTYNSDRYQYELAGLTPHEFYLFKESGIYPCDNYYGVKADRLHSIEEIVNHHLEEASKKAEKMRSIYSLRSRAAQLLRKNPERYGTYWKGAGRNIPSHRCTETGKGRWRVDEEPGFISAWVLSNSTELAERTAPAVHLENDGSVLTGKHHLTLSSFPYVKSDLALSDLFIVFQGIKKREVYHLSVVVDLC